MIEKIELVDEELADFADELSDEALNRSELLTSLCGHFTRPTSSRRVPRHR